MKQTVCITIGILFLLNGCKTFDPSLLRPAERNQHLLPPLEVLYDFQNLGGTFSIPSSRIEHVEHLHSGPSGLTRSVVLLNHPTFDRRLLHIVTIFDREMSNNICETSGTNYGYAVCRIVNIEASSAIHWFVASALTCFTINLLGFPFSNQTAILDIEVEILDSKWKRIARYSALGEDTEYGALYWGYYGVFNDLDPNRNTILSRVVITSAFRDAMDKIRTQIEPDVETLREKLLLTNQMNGGK